MSNKSGRMSIHISGNHIGDNIARDKIVNTSSYGNNTVNVKLIKSEIDRFTAQDASVQEGIPSYEIPRVMSALGEFQKTIQLQYDKPTLLSSLGILLDAVKQFPDSRIFKAVREWMGRIRGEE